MNIPVVRLLLALAAVCLVSGCAQMSSTITLGATDAMTNGRILPVKDNPKSLGRKRLEAYAAVSPALKAHVNFKGFPDRIIETISFGGERKVVMYYTRQGIAYLFVADQFAMPNAKLIGPSPIGAKTRELFAAMDNLERVAGEIVADKKHTHTTPAQR